MDNEALNGSYAKIESFSKKKGKAAGQETHRDTNFIVSLCGGHLDCSGVAESLMKECAIAAHAVLLLFAFACPSKLIYQARISFCVRA
jgi:hypothetical protein